MGYSSWDHKVSDTIEWPTLSLSPWLLRFSSLQVHLTIHTQAQAHTCTHTAIPSTKDHASEEKEWTHSLPHLMKQTQVHCSRRIKILKVSQKVQIKGNTFRYSFVFISGSSSVIKLWPFKNEFICNWEWWVGSWTRVWPFYLSNAKTNATEACRTVLRPHWQSSCPPEIVLIRVMLEVFFIHRLISWCLSSYLNIKGNM